MLVDVLSPKRYLIDENLPPDLVTIFLKHGLVASHVNDIVSNVPVKDSAIRKLTLQQQIVLITKDDDFVKSFVSRAVPDRLIFVFGQFRRSDILSLFELHLDLIVAMSVQYNLVEVNRSAVKAPLDHVMHLFSNE